MLKLHRQGAVGFIGWLDMPHRATNSAERRNDIVEDVNKH